MLTDPPRLARLLADQFVKNQIVYNNIDNKIKLKLEILPKYLQYLQLGAYHVGGVVCMWYIIN